MKNFREVISNIKPGEKYKCNLIGCDINSISMNDIGIIAIKTNYMRDGIVSIKANEPAFELERKQHNFTTAFHALLVDGKAIEPVGLTPEDRCEYKIIDNKLFLGIGGLAGQVDKISFEHIKGMWYINDNWSSR